MKFKLIIFDFDGTLADSFPFFVDNVNRMADTFKFRRFKPSELELMRGLDAAKIIKYAGLPLWKIPIIASHFIKLMARHIGQISLFRGVDDLLRQLSQKNVLLAIASSNSYHNVCRVLGPENAALITFYECGVSLFGKQDRLKKILRKSHISCNEVLYIGDEIRDFLAAQKVGIAFGAVSWGYTRTESLKALSPFMVFDRIDQIIDVVDSL